MGILRLTPVCQGARPQRLPEPEISQDAIVMLRGDHEEVRALLPEFKKSLRLPPAADQSGRAPGQGPAPVASLRRQ